MKRPNTMAKSAKPRASRSDWRCLFSYKRVGFPDERFPTAESRNTRSQAASAAAEPQIIHAGEHPISLPTTARPTDTDKQTVGSDEAGSFWASHQAGAIRMAMAAPTQYPAIPYPAARQSSEIIRQITNNAFRKYIGYCFLCFSLSTRTAQRISHQWK